MPGDPLTQVQHHWVAITVMPVMLFRRPSGDTVIIADLDEESEVSVGCARCDARPSEWGTLCSGEEM